MTTDRKPIYLDNAATVFPKPRAVLDRMTAAYAELGASPGRGGYDLAVEAGQAVDDVRRALADLLGVPDHRRVIFALNATDALNLAINGLIKPGGHVVSTRLEHNSVLRPLEHWRLRGVIDYDLVPFNDQGLVEPDRIEATLRPETCLVVLNHASNVLGTVQPAAEIGRICSRRRIPLLVDVAQSAGVIPIDLTAWQAAAVAFTGHKSLLGPSGVGGLALAPDVEIEQTRFGGTGVDSANLIHTPDYPHRLEAGTLNILGVLGLAAGLDEIARRGMAAIHDREIELLHRLEQGLAEVKRVTLFTRPGLDPSLRTAVTTCTLDGLTAEMAADILDADYGIAVRAGLHCAPLVHRDLGSFPQGGIRFSLGPDNTQADVDAAVAAMTEIAARLVD